jgi:endonuclease/exonuclease/phosphatase family metal-dependent hydrolase
MVVAMALGRLLCSVLGICVGCNLGAFSTEGAESDVSSGSEVGSASATATVGSTSTTTTAGATTGPPLEEVTIATFNARLFFDTTCDSGLCEGGDFESVLSPQAFAARAGQIAEAIAALEADVVVLQEIENDACMAALAMRLPELPTFHLGETGFAASIDVAVMTSLPAIAVVSHQNDRFPLPGGGTTGFTRDLVEMHLDSGGPRVIVLGAHFRSKVNDEPNRRLAEAQRAGVIVGELAAAHPEGLIVLAGDLNDVPSSPPLAALEAQTPLLRVASELDDDATIVFDGDHQAIDHIYVSLVAAGGAFRAGSARIFRGGGGVFGWGGSDHAALRATFDLSP